MKKIVKYCPNCGIEYPADASFCSKCGGSLFLQEREVEKRKNRKPIILIGILVLLVIGGMFFYKAYREVQYEETCKEFLSEVLDGWGIAEDTCNEIASVWYNSIWKVDDRSTNQYTLDANGYFYTDFNDALYSYTSSSKYSNQSRKLSTSMDKVSTLISQLRNGTPQKYERLHDDVEDLLDLYMGYVNLATNFHESYESFIDKLKQYDEGMASKFDRIITYFK